MFDLPDALDVNRNKNQGDKVQGVVLTWGYLQWKATRVQISEDEVDALNDVLRAFVEERNTDVGFGFYLTEGRSRKAARGGNGLKDGEEWVDPDEETDETDDELEGAEE